MSALKGFALVRLVSEAYCLFNNGRGLSNKSSKEHSSIMVEALGRAEVFEEVQEFVGIIPLKLRAWIWSILLLSSRVHGHMKVAKYALEKLIELNPSECSEHIMLNIHKFKWLNIHEFNCINVPTLFHVFIEEGFWCTSNQQCNVKLSR